MAFDPSDAAVAVDSSSDGGDMNAMHESDNEVSAGCPMLEQATLLAYFEDVGDSDMNGLADPDDLPDSSCDAPAITDCLSDWDAVHAGTAMEHGVSAVSGAAEQPVLALLLPADDDLELSGVDETYQAPDSPMDAPVVIDCTSEAEEDTTHLAQDSAQPAALAMPPQLDDVRRPTRRKWDMNNLPAHLEMTSDQFAKRIACRKCGCRTMLQARSAFLSKHWECAGVPSRHREPLHFKRKQELNQHLNLQPGATEVLDVHWYQLNGILPRCVRTSVDQSWLSCTCCGARDRVSNRKRFMLKHIACLSSVLIWHPDNTFEIDEALLHRGSKRPPSAACGSDELEMQCGTPMP
eukprot:6473285-Amphidinium_carterae.1